MRSKSYVAIAKVAAVLLLTGTLMIGLAGCQNGSGTDAPSGPKASSFSSDVEPMWPDQQACPVCNTSPIDSEVYVDVETEDGTRRVYFDKEQCANMFERNQNSYMMRYEGRYGNGKGN